MSVSFLAFLGTASYELVTAPRDLYLSQIIVSASDKAHLVKFDQKLRWLESDQKINWLEKLNTEIQRTELFYNAVKSILYSDQSA